MGFRFQNFSGSVNNKKVVTYVCDPKKRDCYLLLKIALDRLLKVHRKCVVCFFNEIYSCLPQNDKLRNVKFFEGPFLCVTAHRETKL